MVVALLGIGFIGLFFALMSVRLILLKDGQFKGTCASQSPFLNKEGATCGYCGKTMDGTQDCAEPDNEVNKVMSKFN